MRMTQQRLRYGGHSDRASTPTKVTHSNVGMMHCRRRSVCTTSITLEGTLHPNKEIHLSDAVKPLPVIMTGDGSGCQRLEWGEIARVNTAMEAEHMPALTPSFMKEVNLFTLS